MGLISDSTAFFLRQCLTRLEAPKAGNLEFVFGFLPCEDPQTMAKSPANRAPRGCEECYEHGLQ